MTLELKCRCGQVQGRLDPAAAYTRATCYCRDCQAFARFLGSRGITNELGGTDIVPIAPSAVTFDRGHDRIACMSLSDKGLLRWYADCCRTPLGNTGREPAPFYFGLATACLDANEGTLDSAFGRRDRIALFRKHAGGPVKTTPLAFAAGGLGILVNVLAARLRGKRESPFFDAEGQPIRKPQVLSRDERRQVTPEGASGG
jgi:hypothetical protein